MSNHGAERLSAYVQQGQHEGSELYVGEVTQDEAVPERCSEGLIHDFPGVCDSNMEREREQDHFN